MFQLQLFFLLHCDEWDRVVALPRHKFVTGATLLQLLAPVTVTTQLIDVKLYNVLEIHCSCAQWFLDCSLKAGWRG